MEKNYLDKLSNKLNIWETTCPKHTAWSTWGTVSLVTPDLKQINVKFCAQENRQASPDNITVCGFSLWGLSFGMLLLLLSSLLVLFLATFSFLSSELNPVPAASTFPPSASPWRQTAAASRSCPPGRRSAPDHPAGSWAGKWDPSVFPSEPPDAPSSPSHSDGRNGELISADNVCARSWPIWDLC